MIHFFSSFIYFFHRLYSFLSLVSLLQYLFRRCPRTVTGSAARDGMYGWETRKGDEGRGRNDTDEPQRSFTEEYISFLSIFLPAFSAVVLADFLSRFAIPVLSLSGVNSLRALLYLVSFLFLNPRE